MSLVNEAALVEFSPQTEKFKLFRLSSTFQTKDETRDKMGIVNSSEAFCF